MRKPKRRSLKKHRAILDSAAELLIERGYCSVTIDEIAARAGVGKQTIYRWWRSKMELYIELYDEMARRSLKPIDTGSLKKDIDAYGEGLLGQLTNPVASLAFRGMVAEAQGSEASARLFRDYMLGRFAITRTIIGNAKRRGEISRKSDADILSSLVGGAVVWRLLLGDKSLSQKFVTELNRTLLDGLAMKRPRQKLPS